MKWTVLSFLLCFALCLTRTSQAQNAHFSLITPDSGAIDVNWDYHFLWNDKDELYLIIKVPTNIELVGYSPKYLRDALEYELPVRDLFIKVNTVMLGTNRRILSSQGLTIQINDQKRGIVKRDESCPKELTSPLFSRSIITQRCRLEMDGHLISERGFVNGSKYENSYYLKLVAQNSGPQKYVKITPHKNSQQKLSENRGHEFIAGPSLSYLNQKNASAGDGLYLSLLASSDIRHGDFTFSPSLKVGLLGIMTNDHRKPFKTRRDELKLTASYNKSQLTPELHVKSFGRSESEHYLMGITVGAGLHYQLAGALPLKFFGAIYPHISSRHYQNYLLGLTYSHHKTNYTFEINHESYLNGNDVKIQNYGASLNVGQRF